MYFIDGAMAKREISRHAGILGQKNENDILKYLHSNEGLKSWLREICVGYLG